MAKKKSNQQNPPETQPQPTKKITATDLVAQTFCNAYFTDSKPTNEEIQTMLGENKVHMSEDMVSAWRRDVNRILNYLKATDRLK